ncbi:hypothetical protein MVQ23_02760 [Fusobacterium necrophorum]|uniref:hypothetical protein n=1 Tax=Fusobacterium necrophorum TaxID=859 RepID=UPI002551C7EA|nr:hypothetical protein [Fusobacterium necrophorum]MDK4484783.1 hypothetical protein [Fusobacterium necrophorum]
MQTIIANRPLFPRNSFLIINGVKIEDKDNGGLKFEVDAKTGEEGKVGVANIKIYNLSQIIEVGSEIELWFGYDSDVGYYSKYEVIKKKKRKENGDFVQELTCSERTKNSSKIASISLDGNVRISEAIQALIQVLGLNLVSMELKEDKVYTNGYTCYNQGFQELRELVFDSGSKMTVKADDVYIYTEKAKNQVIHLSFESGLIHNPEEVEKQEKEVKVHKKDDNKKEEKETDKKDKFDKKKKKKTIRESNKYDYTIECFPIHYIKKGDILSINSDTLFGFVQVEEVSLSLADSWNMKLEVKVLK